MSSIFESTPQQRPSYNTFNLQHENKLSLNSGMLVPVMVEDCIPGDKFHISTEQMTRMAPMIRPVMARFDSYMHTFFVPYRILWEGFEDFITGGETGFAERSFPVSAWNGNEALTGSLGDYLGLPTHLTGGTDTEVSAMYAAAYAMIYDEYFRDENLIPDKIFQPLSDNANPYYNIIMENKPLLRAYKKDYFTSALPWPQKGPQVTLPMGTAAPILYQPDGTADTVRQATGIVWNENSITLQTGIGGQPVGALLQHKEDGDIRFANIDNAKHLRVDLTNALAATINDLRRSVKLQQWLEVNARSGTRYVEFNQAHYGVRPNDSRLQRPEYVGGSRSTIAISEVLQTSETQGTPLGDMSGHGMSISEGRGISKYCEEHGCLITIMSILPKADYFQGIPRKFQKFDKFDTFFKEFANLGEQPIYNKELYYSGNYQTDNDIFGYTPRYAEYKQAMNEIHGDFRTTQDDWHTARKFANTPALSQDFIEAKHSDIERIFAVLDDKYDHFWVHILFNVMARRGMPVFGVPQL